MLGIISKGQLCGIPCLGEKFDNFQACSHKSISKIIGSTNNSNNNNNTNNELQKEYAFLGWK